MDRVLKRLLEELDDLYVEKTRQVNAASRTGKVERIGKVLVEYRQARQRILDGYGQTNRGYGNSK